MFPSQAVTAADTEVVSGWASTLAGSLWERELLDEPIQLQDAAAKLMSDVMRGGWLELAMDERPDVATMTQCAFVLHNRPLPLPLPILESWLGLRLLTGSSRSVLQEELLAQAADGSAVVLAPFGAASSTGSRSGGVLAPSGGDYYLITAVGADAVELWVGRTEAAKQTKVGLDPTLATVNLEFDADALVFVGVLPLPEWQGAQQLALCLQAAALAGQSQALLAATLDYLGVRTQFGQLIGSFQAVKHLAVDLYVALRGVMGVLDLAASDPDISDAPVDLRPALVAKATAGASASRVAREAVQLHGGIGFTWEAGLHFGARRIMYHAGTGMTVADCHAELGRDLTIDGSDPWPMEPR